MIELIVIMVTLVVVILDSRTLHAASNVPCRQIETSWCVKAVGEGGNRDSTRVINPNGLPY